jgi:hypothetical protein
MSTIKLDSKGCATCQITVKNVSRAALDGRAVLISLPITRPPSGAVEKNWVKIDGATDRHFAVDQEEVFSIKIAVVQKKGDPSPEGSYAFRMDVVNVAQPDDSGDQSQALGFTVAAAAPQTKPRWPLIAVIAAVVLIAVGVTVWLLTRGKSSDSGTTSTVSDNGAQCVTFTPAKAVAQSVGGHWKVVVDGNQPLFDFDSRPTVAQQAVQVLQSYNMNKSCTVGAPASPSLQPSFSYMLSGTGNAPTGSATGEFCTQFDPTVLNAAPVTGGIWTIYTRANGINNYRLFNLRNEADASTSVNLIKQHGFTSLCSVGGGNVPFVWIYMKK